MGKFTSYITGQTSVLLPSQFQSDWNEFVLDCETNFAGIKFELVKSNRVNTSLICCRPILDASATTTLAIIENTASTSLRFRTVNADDWTNVSDSTTFVSCLGALVENGSQNSRMITLMQGLNNTPLYEGILVTGEPYEIKSDSIRVSISNQECRNILDKANNGNTIYEYDVRNASIITTPSYPQTSTTLPPNYQCRFFTLQGFLFEVIVQPTSSPNNLNLINFKIKFRNNMRM